MALSLRYADSLIILAISFASAIICEAISWILIYRTASYKSLRSTIDKAARKLEVMKGTSTGASAVSSSKSSKVKKMDRLESSLKESSRDLSFSKFKSGGVVAIVLVVVFGLLNSLFEAGRNGEPFRMYFKMFVTVLGYCHIIGGGSPYNTALRLATGMLHLPWIKSHGVAVLPRGCSHGTGEACDVEQY